MLGRLFQLMDDLEEGQKINPALTAFQDFVQAQKDLLDVPEPGKSDEKAAQLRQEGNRLYKGKRYEKALGLYNESICYAEAGSEQLGLSYANRSAVYYEQGEYEFALLNIRLAKGHNYPEKMMEKLELRERNCWQKIDEGLAKDNRPCPRMGINVEVNPKVPFLAKGLAMKQYPGCGRGMVAERDFKAGDVILDEKSILGVVNFPYKYFYCSHCGIPNQHSLIPCPNCVSYMYCSEECRTEDKRQAHRFECGIGAQLENINLTCSNLASKLFFYGLTLFNDDLDEMMKYCEKNVSIGADPFTLDHTKYDPLEEFKLFHKAKIWLNESFDFPSKLNAAASYEVLMKQPLIKSLITTESQKRFFLNILHHYQRVATYFSYERKVNGTEYVVGGMVSYGKLINHSCDPNAMTLFDAGRVKCFLIRPVRKGEQITSSLGPAWFVFANPQAKDLSFKCRCKVCRFGHVRDYLKKFGKPLPAKAHNELELCMEVWVNETANAAAKLNAYQQIIQRYDKYLPNVDMSYHLWLYIDMQQKAILRENIQLNRAKVANAVKHC